MIMKKKIFILIMGIVGLCAFSYANGSSEQSVRQELNLEVRWGDLVPGGNPVPRTPILIPEVSIDGHTLYFDTPCDGYTLRILSSDNTVEYTTVIPTGATSLVLPATLSGNFEIRFETATYYYYGYISL